MIRIITTAVLTLAFATPAISTDAYLLFCTVQDRAPMQLSECCCVGQASEAECESIEVASCCCEVRPAFERNTPAEAALQAPQRQTPRFVWASPLIVVPARAAQDLRPRAHVAARPSPPKALFLLTRSLLI